MMGNTSNQRASVIKGPKCPPTKVITQIRADLGSSEEILILKKSRGKITKRW